HDRGIGIRPEDRAHLADGFFRADDERVRRKGGAGLGLALVRHIVEAHNGSLAVESRLVKGSAFRVFLPEAGQRASEANPPVPRESHGQSPQG
ncbi:MAG: ATP-binding protein, partial [Phycisphaerae bacterium]